MYVIQQLNKWEEYLLLVEFSYNNSSHKSLKLSPFEVPYGRRYNKPTNWNNPKEKLMLGPDMLEKMEIIVKKIWENLKPAQIRKKAYADWKMNFREFQVGDHVYIQV